jgi:hypothetical protein
MRMKDKIKVYISNIGEGNQNVLSIPKLTIRDRKGDRLLQEQPNDFLLRLSY